MTKSKQELFVNRRLLDPKTIRSFVGVRGRVKAAVAAQPRSVSLAQALAQVQRVKTEIATVK